MNINVPGCFTLTKGQPPGFLSRLKSGALCLIRLCIHWSTHHYEVPQVRKGKTKPKPEKLALSERQCERDVLDLTESPPVLTPIPELPSQRSSTLGGRRVSSHRPLQHPGDCPDKSTSPQVHSEPSRWLATGQEAKHSSGNTGNSGCILELYWIHSWDQILEHCAQRGGAMAVPGVVPG